MNLASRMKNPLAILLSIILLLVAALPATAADTAKQVEVRLKVGSKQMSINGEKITIQAPFNSGKIVMAPLSVFTNAKGFAVTLKPVNKNIQLTYAKHTVTITKNSKAATIDGKKATLPAAPVDKSSVTMVPVEAIAKAFGIKLTTDAKTKELVLKGTVAAPAKTTGNSIDTDAGKSKVGDSYYKWSMNMPTNLAQDEQWDKGSKITFADVKGDFYMGVFVEKAEESLDAKEQSDMMKRYLNGETTLDVSSIVVGGNKFQRLVTKDKDGFFYEYRGIQANGNFYMVIFGKKGKAKTELEAYKSLLDSFQTSFDASNKSLKDLTIVKNGKIAYSNANYGLKVQLPIEWSEDKSEDRDVDVLTYNGPNDADLSIKVSSILPGDTVDAWIEREKQQLQDTIIQDYWKIGNTSSIIWNGIPAKVVTLELRIEEGKWYEITRLFAIKGNYKYDLSVSYEQSKKGEVMGVILEMLNWLKVDFPTIEANFGQVPDEDDTMDRMATVTKTSKKYGYSVTVPKYWVDGVVDMETDGVDFKNDSGVGFSVLAIEGESIGNLPDYFVDKFTNEEGYKLDTRTLTTIAGVSATKLQFSISSSGSKVGLTMTIYMLEKNGNVYLVQTFLAEPGATSLSTKQLEDAVNSFTFN